jgi:hypothetical protein
MKHITIINETRGQTLAERCDVANTFLTRGRGLLGRSALEEGAGLLLYPSASIHMFFMKFSIDVLFVDAADYIVGLRADVPPGLPYVGARGARYVIELPVGTIAHSGSDVGDHLLVPAWLHGNGHSG